jgi:hypothetical protein
MAVLKLPFMLLKSARKPTAVLSIPVSPMSASSPRTVFWFVKQPSWQVARACGASANHTKARTNRISRNTSRTGDQPTEFVVGEVFVFIMRRFCLFCSPHGNDKMICTVAMMRVIAFTIALAFLCSSAAAEQPTVTFVSPCECQGFHGVNRWVAKPDLPPVPFR